MTGIRRQVAKPARNKIRRSAGEKVFDVANITFILLLVAITIYPLLYTVFASFSDARALLTHAAIPAYSGREPVGQFQQLAAKRRTLRRGQDGLPLAHELIVPGQITCPQGLRGIGYKHGVTLLCSGCGSGRALRLQCV